MLTTHGLNIISVKPEPCVVSISIARPKRRVLRLLNVWKRWDPAKNDFQESKSLLKSGKLSIKKMPGHLLGIDNFVNQCWKIDPLTGDSNFDIDGDRIDTLQPSLFPEDNIPKKIQKFEKELKDEILGKKLITNTAIYKYAMANGFKAEHARNVLKKLIKDGNLPRQKVSLSYDSCKTGKQPQQIVFGSVK